MSFKSSLTLLIFSILCLFVKSVFKYVPIFCSYSAKRVENVLNKDGSVEQRKFIDLKLVLDERICDGHYYSSGLKKINEYLKHPERMEQPVEPVPDIY